MFIILFMFILAGNLTTLLQKDRLYIIYRIRKFSSVDPERCFVWWFKC